ncbi:MAG: mannose-phosphate guanylyltransferase / phosphomannomutase [Blastocatellia bacterium]|jgi:NDP-sugar pyrophosphorylase family protein|nr:mannose-phosphate guanylyltransferase / phosphomannomutase [Blastocatellia bacterium]
MRAMILAAGYGTRLWPLTIDRTKPAIPFMGRPLVGYVAEYLSRNDCREVVVNLHHRPDSVRAALGDGARFGVHLEYVEEPEILGTSGALDNARHLLEGETFAVVNGKIVTDIDLRAALATHKRTGALATLVLRPNPQRERFSIVETRDGLIKAFGGMPAQSSEAEDAPLMFTGIHILEPRIFDFIPRGVASDFVPHVYQPAIAQGELIAAHVSHDEMWYELSTIPRYLDISLALLKSEGRDVLTGASCEIEEGADVRDSILWDGVTIEAGGRVRRAVLGEGVRIRAGEVIENAAVVRAGLVAGSESPPKALKGELRGANFVVPLPQ